MKPHLSINPQRAASLTVAALVLLAAGLRWWGANWPPFHPDEWTVHIVEAVSRGDFYLSHPIVWHQAVFILLGYLYGPIDFILAGFQNLLGQAGSATAQLPYLLFGRVMVGALSALNAWAVYRLWLRLHPWRAGGVAAAALVAVCPLLVAQSHYLTVDAPLALAITFCLWSAVELYQTGRWWTWLVGGLAAGLAITTKSNALVVLGCFALAHVLHVLDRKPRWYMWLLAQPALGFAGLAAGMCLGYPGYLFGEDGPITRYIALATKFTAPRYHVSASFLESPFGDRLSWSMRTITDAVGWEFVILFALGLALAVWQRRRTVWIVASYPFLFYFPYLIFGNRVGERDLPSLIPSLILLSVYTLAWLGQRVSRRPALQTVALGIVTLGLAVCPLLGSIEASYLYWQDDTRITSGQWTEATLPGDARLHVYGYHPAEVMFHETPRLEVKKPQTYYAPRNFLTYSSTSEDRYFYGYSGKPHSARGRFVAGMDKHFLLLKEFDLKTSTPRDKRTGRLKFPLFVDPYIKIYAGRPPRAVSQPLALPHPSVYTDQPYRIAYTNHPQYSLDEAAGVCGEDGSLTRVLRPPTEPELVEVELVNLGRGMVRVCFSQGPLQGQSLYLHPAQTWRTWLKPDNWPAPVMRVYPFSIQVDPPQPVLMRVISDPLVMGLGALERGDWERARSVLTPARQASPEAMVPAGLLAAALCELGKTQEAAGLLAGREKALEDLAALAGADLPRDPWLARLESFTGYYPDLLLNGLTRRYRIDPYPLPRWYQERAQTKVGSGFTVRVSSLPRDKGTGSLALVRTFDVFPALPLKLKAHLTWPGFDHAVQGPLAELSAARFGPAGERATPSISVEPGSATCVGRMEVDLDLPAGLPEDHWELRLVNFGKNRVRVAALEVGVDPHRLVNSQARWVLLAWARVLASQGQGAKAAQVLETTAHISPGFLPALPDTIKLLSAQGRNQALTDYLAAALPHLDTRPDLLARGRQALERLGRADRAAEYAERLNRLRPAAAVGTRFDNGAGLAGYTLSGREVKPGGELDLTLYWHFEAAAPFDPMIFTHLNRAGGQLNYDHRLAAGARTMDRVRAGEMVVDRVALEVPKGTKPGEYRLSVGMYWGKTRRSIIQGPDQGDSSVDLGLVKVLPGDKP